MSNDEMREAKNALDRLFNGAVLQGYPRKTAEYLREAIEAALSRQPPAQVPDKWRVSLVNSAMIAAGMDEWTQKMNAGERHWPNMLEAVFVAMANAAPSVAEKPREAGPIYTCRGKGGRYEYLGGTIGAGKSRGETVQVYRDCKTGQLFHRDHADFTDRMGLIEDLTPESELPGMWDESDLIGGETE